MPGKEFLKLIELKRGYFRFLASFTWEGPQDDVATSRFVELLKSIMDDTELPALADIHKGTLQGYYVTGERNMIVIGQVKSTIGLQNFCSFFTFKTGMRAKISHILEVNELYNANLMKPYRS